MNLRDIQKRLNITNHEIADALGLSRSTIQKWKSKNSTPPEHVCKFLRLLDVMSAGDKEIFTKICHNPESIYEQSNSGRDGDDCDNLAQMDKLSLQKAYLTLRKKLQLTEEKLIKHTDESQELHVQWLPDTTVIYANNAYCNKFGYSYENVVGRRWINRIDPPELKAQLKDWVNQIIKEKKPITFETKSFNNATNQYGFISWKCFPIVGENSELIEIVSLGLDVDQEKFLQKKSIYLEESLHQLMDRIPYPVWIINSEGKLLSMGKAGEAFARKLNCKLGSNVYQIFEHSAQKQIIEQIETLEFENTAEFNITLNPELKPNFDHLEAYLSHINWMGFDGYVLILQPHYDSIPNKGTLSQERLKLEKFVLNKIRPTNGSTKLQTKSNVDKSIPDLLKSLGYILNVDRCYIFLVDSDHQTVSNTHEWCAENIEAQIEDLQNVPMDLTPWWMQTMNKGEMVIIDDVQQLPLKANKEQEILQAQGISALMATPLISRDGGFMGFLGVDYNQSPRRWQKKELLEIQAYSKAINTIILQNQQEIEFELLIHEWKNVMQAGQFGSWRWRLEDDTCELDESVFHIIGDDFEGKTSGVASSLWLNRVHPEDQTKLIQEMNKLKSGETKDIELTYRVKDGNNRCIYILDRAMVAHHNHSGVPAVIVGIIQDVTNIREREQSEVKRLQKESEVNLAKMEFLSNVSHELRTPINGMSGMLQLIEREKLDSENLDFVENLDICLQEIHDSVEKLINFSELNSGYMHPNLTTFSLKEFIESLEFYFVKAAEKKGLDFNVKIEGFVPRLIIFDLEHLKKIGHTLISNAIKFTSEGSVSLILSGHPCGINHFTLCLEVKDTGIGISDEMKSLIFKPFEQASRGLNRSFNGMGMGLSIARSLIGMYDGKIMLESELNCGSSFQVELPVQVDDWISVNRDKSSETVLVVEDNAMNQRLMAHLLKKHGLLPVIVENGKEALAWIHKNRADLVLLDIQMPVLDGRGFLRAYRDERKKGELYEVPIVVVSALINGKAIEEFPEYPIKAVLPKPFTVKDFTDILSDFFPAHIEKPK